jgi:hypothetical protein
VHADLWSDLSGNVSNKYLGDSADNRFVELREGFAGYRVHWRESWASEAICNRGSRALLWVKGRGCDYVGIATGVPPTTADLRRCQSRQPWAKSGRASARNQISSLNLECPYLKGVAPSVGAGIWNGFDVERGSCPWFATGFRTGANQTASVAVDAADLDASCRAPSSDAAYLQRGSRDDARSGISTVCQLFLAATLELRRVWAGMSTNGKTIGTYQDPLFGSQ